MSEPPAAGPSEAELPSTRGSEPRSGAEPAIPPAHAAVAKATDSLPQIAAMPILDVGIRTSPIESEPVGLHRSSVPPRPVPRPGASPSPTPPRPVPGGFPPPSFPPPSAVTASMRPPSAVAPAAPIAAAVTASIPAPATPPPAVVAAPPAVVPPVALAPAPSFPPPGFPPPSLPPSRASAPPDSDVDEEGFLRSDALHTLLDPSELSGVRDAARFTLKREPVIAEEADDGADIPIEIGPELTASENGSSSEAATSAPAPTSAPVSEQDSSRDSLEVEIDAGSEPAPVQDEPRNLANTTLTDPERHTVHVPSDRNSEVPTEVDPEDMEIEEVASSTVRIAAGGPPSGQPRSSGAELAAAVEAQNANETPAFKRTRYWWDELFGDDFLRTMDKLTDAQVRHEVNFIEESLGVQKSGLVLDLACGVGRHAVEMASRGYNVVGYDLSVAMLARAADEAQERQQKLNFLHGDMRDMGFEEMFDGIYSWSTSFGYFDDEKNLLVAQNIHRALRKGGMFLLDLANRDFVAQRQPSLVWFEGEGCVCMDEMRIDFITSRLKVKRMVMLEDGRSRELDYSIRLYTLHELGRMLHEVGFRVTEVSGQPATRGVFMGADSPRMIVLAEKAD